VAQSADMTEIARLAQEFWDLSLSHSPINATLLGDHRFDDQIDDLSDESAAALVARLTEMIGQAERIEPSSLSSQDAITRSMLISEARNQVTLVETGVLFAPCDPMLGPVVGLLLTIGQIAASTPEQAEALFDRYRQVPRYFNQALTRHHSEIAVGRTPIRVNVERVLSQIDSYLSSPLETDPFANLAGPEDWSGYDDWRERLKTLAAETVRPSFAKYRVGAVGLLDDARDEDHAGLLHVPGGDEIYERLIEVFTSLPVTARELHDVGLSEAKGKLAQEFVEIGGRAFGEGSLSGVLARLRTDPSLRYSTADEIVADAKALVERAWQAAPDWFNLRPTRNCSVTTVPESLAKDAPPAYYLPPAMDGSRTGTYFINTHDPQERVRYDTESVAFHEANPGHHFQISLAQELEDLPPFRQNALTTAYVEGWGLYSERLAEEMGLYSSDLGLLGMVSADAWRAGRLVVDTGFHAFGWTRAQAVNFFQEWSAIDQPTIETEVDRYIGVPGQALAYKVGQREIFRLRAKAMKRLGDRFDIKGFHDAVLGSGPVTLPLLGELVQDWIGSKRS
jgi:uncharacterized protein (DUF885 family)